MGHLFNVDGVSTSTPSPFTNVRPFTNGQPSYYWSATVPPGSPGTAFLFSFSDGIQFNEEFFFPQYTWAVSPGYLLPLDDAVPIPAAVWLFGGALGALGWIRRRQAKA